MELALRTFMNQDFASPTIRVGILPINFSKEDYKFMKAFAKNSRKTVQQLADTIWSNKYYPDDRVNIHTGEIIELSINSLKKPFRL